MIPVLITIVQALAVFAIAPFTFGLVRTCKARLQGRRGPSPFLPYVSFATLLKKEMVISTTTSWVFRAVPYVVLGSTMFLALVLPLFGQGGAFAVYSDFVLVAAVLAIGAVFLVLGGLDVGSAFGGMGSSREMTISSLIEPAMIMTFATFAMVTHTGAIDQMLATPALISGHPFLIFSVISLILVALAENARYPVDNPATHLELTMVHEAMILEYSGPYLAMLEYASALKLTIFALLVGNIIAPFTLFTPTSDFGAFLLAIIGFVVKICLGMGLLALLESTIAKMRFYRMQEYVSAAFFIAFLGMALALFTFVL